MSNITNSFLRANPTHGVRPPEKEKPTEGTNTSTSTNLSRIVPPVKFKKAVPPSSRNINSATNRDRLLSTSNLEEESSTENQEGSATGENEASSSSESEKSTEKNQQISNSEQNSPIDSEQPPTSGREAPIQTQWQPTTTTVRRIKLEALKYKKPKLKREKAQSMPRKPNLDLNPLSNLAFSSNAVEFDHPLVLSPTSNRNDSAKKPLYSLIPKRLVKTLKEAISTEAEEPLVYDEITDTNARQAFDESLADTLKSLHKSKLYQDASKENEYLATLRPLVLQSFLLSLLKNADALETIEKYKLTAEEAVAIRWYGREGFQYVQRSLRRKPEPSVGEGNAAAPLATFESLVKACERAFAKLPALPPGMELFRGTNFLFDENLKPGDVYTDPAFVSTTTLEDVADRKEGAEEKGKGKFAGCYLLKIINVPGNDPRWRDIHTLTGNPTEAEILGLPNMGFKVVSRGGGAGQGAGVVGTPEIITLEPIPIH